MSLEHTPNNGTVNGSGNGAAPHVMMPAMSASPSVIPCWDPATGESLGEVPVDSPDRVKAIVARARVAQKSWATTSFEERRRVLARLRDYLLDHTDELVELIARDAGKTRENALIGEIWPVCEKIRHTIATGERDLATERVSPGLLAHKIAEIEYHPLGVIGVICPWNFPLQNILGPAIPALMAGNAVVIKVSEWVAWSAPRFQAMFDQILDATGHSTDLVRIINGYAETGVALCESGIDKIVFTGSMPNGRRVAAQCAKTLTPVVLELGGKDAMIVCEDANLDQAVHAAFAGTFISSGQMCLAAERVMVVDKVYDAFVDKAVALASQLRQGPPLDGVLTDVGAMTMPHQVDIVERLVEDALARGAKAAVGGKRGNGGQGGKGSYFQPTVLTGVTSDMRIANEETFGPVLCIFHVALASQLRQGPPLDGVLTDVGAMTMPHQVDIVERLVEDALARGAKAAVGGKRGNRGNGGKGSYFQPTVLTGVTSDMRIANEETFGPVLCIFHVADEEAAVALANSTEYGLGSTVFSTDHARARRIAARLRAGSTITNDFGLAYMANDLPFGGVGGSGYGRLNGREGIRGMCNQKSVMRDRFPIHQPIKLYPVKAGDYAKNRATIELLYRPGIANRARALISLITGSFKR